MRTQPARNGDCWEKKKKRRFSIGRGGWITYVGVRGPYLVNGRNVLIYHVDTWKTYGRGRLQKTEAEWQEMEVEEAITITGVIHLHFISANVYPVCSTGSDVKRHSSVFRLFYFFFSLIIRRLEAGRWISRSVKTPKWQLWQVDLPQISRWLTD